MTLLHQHKDPPEGIQQQEKCISMMITGLVTRPHPLITWKISKSPIRSPNMSSAFSTRFRIRSFHPAPCDLSTWALSQFCSKSSARHLKDCRNLHTTLHDPTTSYLMHVYTCPVFCVVSGVTSLTFYHYSFTHRLVSMAIYLLVFCFSLPQFLSYLKTGQSSTLTLLYYDYSSCYRAFIISSLYRSVILSSIFVV